ncbi:hypothetical protein [Natronoglycomyces albus]|uniref:ABC transporter permease n=1 Tax=Natronoglycomyces albus TaxID=2811108 RepID=A0A895XP07_9ACTN|nr:hypothetical protein [Natronoglycomyces albus]QSB05119.1 hypothetical protein JQS30_15380 [Natronoglycomyces albus]
MNRPRNPRVIAARIGFGAARNMEAGGLRFAALAFAAFMIVISVATLAVTFAVASERAQRALDGTPVYADTDTSQSSVVLVQSIFDNLQGSRQFEVFYLSPLGEDAPLPPGLSHWPQPGEAVLSPALLEKGGSEKIESRYGDVVGTIGSEGLLDAGQLLAYVRPLQDLEYADSSATERISGWGVDDTINSHGVHWILQEQDFSVGALAALAIAMLLIPACALMFIAARIAAHSRDRREHLVMILGGTARHRRWIAIGETAPPILAGTVFAGLLLPFVLVFDINLPYAEFTIAADDVRSHWLPLAATPFIGIAVTVSIALGLARGGKVRNDSTRPLPAPRHRRLIIVASLCPVFISIAVILPQFFMYTPGYMIFHWLGTIGAMVTLPAVIGVASSWAGKSLARTGRARRNAPMLIAGSWMHARPRAITRQVTGLAMGIVLFFLAAAYQALLAGNSETAELHQAQFGTSTVTVSPNGSTDITATDQFLGTVDDHAKILAIETVWDEESQENITLLAGSCEDIADLGSPCHSTDETEIDPRTVDPFLAVWLGHNPLQTRQGDVADAVADGAALLMIDKSGSGFSIPELKRSARVFPQQATVTTPGERWGNGAIPIREQSRWIGLFGITGLALLGLVAAVAAAGEFLRYGTALAPLAAITGTAGTHRRIAAWSVAAPITATVLIGVAIGIWITRPLTLYTSSPPGWGTATLVTVVVTATGILMWWWASSIAVACSQRWRPGRE